MNNLHGLQEMTGHFSNSCNLLKTKLNVENSEIEPRNKTIHKIHFETFHIAYNFKYTIPNISLVSYSF